MRKKTFLFLMGILFSLPLLGQVGVNTNNPSTTFEIAAKTSDGSSAEGLIPPKMTGDALYLASRNNHYGTAQDGAIVYVTAVPSVANMVGHVINIKTKGYYYYDSTENKWMKFSNFLPPASIGAFTCVSISFSFTSFNQGMPVSGTLTVPYTGGNGGEYPASSFTVNGVTFTLRTGMLSTTGSGNLVYHLTGTPTNAGPMAIPITFGGQTCNVNATVVAGTGSIAALTCPDATYSFASFTQGVAVTGTLTVPYTGGNGGNYPLSSFTHNGLTFTLPAGALAVGGGNLVYNITGSPTNAGPMTVPITFLGKSCTLPANVNIGAASIAALTCGSATFANLTLTQGLPATGTLTIPYTGGNGGNYPLSTFTVNGVIFTAPAGTLLVGPGNLVYNMSGTPTNAGVFYIPVNFLGKTCSIGAGVVPGAASIGYFVCGDAQYSFSSLTQGVAVPAGSTLTILYINGNGGTYPASSFTVNGLTFSVPTGTVANGDGYLVYNVSGAPTNAGPMTVPISFAGSSCNVVSTVQPKPASIGNLACALAAFNAGLTLTQGVPVPAGSTFSVAYINGNGGVYPTSSFTANGLTFTAPTGTVLTGTGDNIIFNVTGAPTTAGSFNVPVAFLGKSCSKAFVVNIGAASIAALTCGSAAYSFSSLTQGVAVTGTLTVPYTGGNGGTYPASSFVVNGLTFSLSAGTLLTGGGNIVYNITGTPTTAGVFNVSLTFLGKTCTFTSTAGSRTTIVLPGNPNAWMRHNIGADTNLDPDVPVQGIAGNYYQWGRSAVVATAYTTQGNISGWNTAPAPNNSWQDGVKTAQDPCPAGFRIPTSTQFQNLINSNTQSNVGNFSASSSSYYAGAKVFGTGSNKLTLTLGGFRQGQGQGPLRGYGQGAYWTSTTADALEYAFFLSFTGGATNVPSFERTNGMFVRCIAQ